jgi:Holliday junction resolvase
MRARGRTDANQSEVVEKFRGMGYSVAITSALGSGFPDIVVGKYGITVLVEIKDGAKPPSKRKLTEDEQRFHDTWRGSACVVECEEDCEALEQWLRDTYQNFVPPIDSL